MSYFITNCLRTFNNKYSAAVTSDLKENESDSNLGFRRISIEQRQFEIKSFEVKSLENMYEGLLEFDGIPYSSHVTRFVERLKNVFPSVEKRAVKKKKSWYVFRKTSMNWFRKNSLHRLFWSHFWKSLLQSETKCQMFSSYWWLWPTNKRIQSICTIHFANDHVSI